MKERQMMYLIVPAGLEVETEAIDDGWRKARKCRNL